MKRTIFAIAAAALTATPALAANWDTNDDGSVSSEEFRSGYVSASAFDRFDDDDNGVLSPEELGLSEPTPLFNDSDANNNGTIEPDEAGRALFVSYDEDENESLDSDEFAAYEEDEANEETMLDDITDRGPQVNK